MFNTYLFALARSQSALSQKDFAERLGVKQALLSKYENGLIEPSSEMVQRIASVLDYQVSLFNEEISSIPSGLIFHRKRNALSAKMRSRIEAEVCLRALDILYLTKRDGIHSDVVEWNGETPAQLAQKLRKAWQLGAGPIDDVCALFEQHNIVVLKMNFGTEQLDAFLLPLQSNLICIALNSALDRSPDRQRHSLCHELGHALLHRDAYPCKEIEAEADEFASEFLAPMKELENSLKPEMRLDYLKQLKSQWKVSIASLLYRAYHKGIVQEKVYKRSMVYLSSLGYRKQEPLCGVRVEHPALLRRLILTAYERDGANLIDALHLSKKRFEERYPYVNEGGLGKCNA